METPILKADPEVGTATPVPQQAPPDPTLPWKALSLTFFLAGIALAAGVASSGRGGGGGSDDDARRRRPRRPSRRSRSTPRRSTGATSASTCSRS